MMNRKLELLMNTAVREANRLKHEYLTLESVLYAMLSDDQQIRAIIEYCGGSVKKIKEELHSYITDEANFSILDYQKIEDLSKKQFVDENLRRIAENSGIYYQPEISLALQRVIQRAAIHVQSVGKRDIRSSNLLVAMGQEKESFAVYLLKKHGIEKSGILEAIGHGADKPSTNQGQDNERTYILDGDGQGGTLADYTVNLSQKAVGGGIDCLVGREEELMRIIQILCRRKKNNPLLVGEAGVGKTAIVEGLAVRIVEGRIPSPLKGATLYSLDMASLLAGAKFRGDFEQRMKSLLGELEKRNKGGKKSILFIDEIHMAMGAGVTAGSHVDVSNLLRTELCSGTIKCMGSTTYREYRQFIEKDAAFSRRFQKIDVKEPSHDETYNILLGLKDQLEKYHRVKYSSRILRYIVEVTDKYIPDRMNPDKSIDIMDETGVIKGPLSESKGDSSITKKDVEAVVAKLASIPRISVAGEERETLKNLKRDLKMLIYGQDHAVDKVVDTVILSRVGLGREYSPVASFLFAGPTGVGKTELARQLSIHLGIHLERIDMSEYMEKHSVAKLIGAPPGYVGHDQGGLLTDAVRKHPHCVVLLDEIEKAHRDVYNILLQVMDGGKLTDSHGRSSDFRNTIIIMTTNQGGEESQSSPIGFGIKGAGSDDSKRDRAIKRFFTPEFRNRLDAIIHFKGLDQSFVLQIVEKFLTDLEAKLEKKNIELEVHPDVKKWLAKKGYGHEMGARALARMIDEKIKRPLSQEILFGRTMKRGKVSLNLNSQWESGKNEPIIVYQHDSHRKKERSSTVDASVV